MLRNPFQYSISTWFVVTFLIAVGMTIGPATWFLIAVIEGVLFYFLCEYFAGNLPRAIETQLESNGFRADGTPSTKRRKIEASERLRFKRNISVLVLVFFAATNVGFLALRVDRIFEGETYVINSPSVQARPGRIISESQLALEIGNRELGITGQNTGDANFIGNTRLSVLLVVTSIWFFAVALIPVGYMGMLRTMAVEASARSENYRTYDYANASDRSNAPKQS